MTAQIAIFPDNLEYKLRRTANALAELAVDMAGYCSYCFQRSDGMTVEGCKVIRINSWSPERIDAVEAIWQKEQKELSQ